MPSILCYIENYLVGGGNRYFVDALNAISTDNDILIFSNENGLFPQDFKRIQRPFRYEALKVWSIETLHKSVQFHHRPPVIQFLFKVIFKFFRVLITAVCSRHNRNMFRKALNDVKPDLVFSFNGGYPGGYSCLDMILEAAEHNITRYLCAVSTPTRIKWSERILYGKIKEAVDVVIVNSKSIKEALMFKRKFSEAKIQVVYTPIHKNQNGADPETFLRAINISRDKSLKIVGYSGRIEAAKGVFYLVQAFAELAAKHKDARLILVGSGRDTVRLKNYIKQLRMEKAVILPGYYGGSINDVLSALDLYVFPSLWEGLPYALLEAMAAQKIIVSTNVGGIPEAIDDHKEGLLVPPADVGALKEAMDQILSDIEGCRHWGRNAKLKAETVFSYDHFILRMNAALSLRAL